MSIFDIFCSVHSMVPLPYHDHACMHGPSPYYLHLGSTPTTMLSIRLKALHRFLPLPLPCVPNGIFVDATPAPSESGRSRWHTSQSSSQPRRRWQHSLELEQRRHFHLTTTCHGHTGNLNDLCKTHIELPVEDFADGCREFDSARVLVLDIMITLEMCISNNENSFYFDIYQASYIRWHWEILGK